MSIAEDKPLALICGAGGGLGAALVKTFSSKGYQVIGLNRSEVDVAVDEEVADAECQQLDCSDSAAVHETLVDVYAQYGTPAVYIHNPAHLVIKPLADTSEEEFTTSWQSMTLSAFTMFSHVLPMMREQGQGTVIVSGATASIRGGGKFGAFASAKFALRGLTQSVAREFQPHGIHVVHVLLDGIIDTPRSRELHTLSSDRMIDATELAGTYLSLVRQPKSVWTHELDLRPQSENF